VEQLFLEMIPLCPTLFIQASRICSEIELRDLLK
jgi:hypothetical protein